MSASNRASLIGKLQTALKKLYQPLPTQPTRPLLEHVLYASLLEDAPADLADEGMAKCEQEFFDWNEVRVTTITELSQVLENLPDPQKAARRLKSNLQAIFEEFYTFDLDHLKKENLGKAVAKFEKMPGMTPFVLNYTVQNGLGGHAIPVDYSAMVIMLATEIASQSEAMAGKVPGLERAIPKNKAIDFSGLLHQAAVALNASTKDKTARQLLDAVNKGSSERLDQWLASKKAAKKRVVKRKADERAAAEEAERLRLEEEQAALEKKAAKKAAAEKAAAAKVAAAEKAAAEKAAEEKAAAAAKAAQAKAAEKAAKSTKKKKATASKSTSTSTAKKKGSKKVSAAVSGTKKVTKKTAKKSSKKTVAAKTPAKKKSAKKSPVKKKTAKKLPVKKATKKKASAKKASAKKPSTTKTKPKSAKKTPAKKSASRKLTKRKPR
ncbi:MAG: hypothetical protein L7U72_01660 [Rubripirellula sp.]|nr:hypothetical protein [Rubripirellula sp.]